MFLSRDPDVGCNLEDLYDAICDFDDGILKMGVVDEVNDLDETDVERKKMSRMRRYSRYMPKWINDEQWETLLGADVNNLKHLAVTYILGHAFFELSSERYSPEQKNIILMTALVHDLAEPITGDKSYDQKTEDDEAREAEVLNVLITDLFEKVGIDCDVNEIYGILYNKRHPLYEAFNAIERIGYMRTAIRAWEVKDENGWGLAANLAWLASNVLGNQIEALLDYSYRHQAVYGYLREKYDVINEMFERLREDLQLMMFGDKLCAFSYVVFDLYRIRESEEEYNIQVRKFLEAYEKWQLFWDQVATLDYVDDMRIQSI